MLKDAHRISWLSGPTVNYFSYICQPRIRLPSSVEADFRTLSRNKSVGLDGATRALFFVWGKRWHRITAPFPILIAY